jgi:hypothetical protein
MRNLLVAAAALAVGGFLALTSARADMVFNAGGPLRQGNMCQFTTDPGDNGNFGYWAPCPDQPVSAVKRSRAPR